MSSSPAFASPLRIDVVSIVIDTYDVEYTGEGFNYYEARKNAGSHPQLAGYPEGFAGDASPAAPSPVPGGLGRLRFPGAGSSAAQRPDAGERHRTQGGP